MTEAEWLVATKQGPTLAFLRGRAGSRKLRLFAVACCRRVERLVQPPWDRVLEAAERHADGLLDDEELSTIRASVGPVRQEMIAVEAAAMPGYFPPRYADDAAGHAALAAAVEVAPGYPRNRGARQKAEDEEEARQCAILRDIVGNPFRPASINPAWLTPTVTALAQQMYDSREFSAMPVLADALQDSGCDDADVLGHCRGPGPHVRGCWVLDLVLGKQ